MSEQLRDDLGEVEIAFTAPALHSLHHRALGPMRFTDGTNIVDLYLWVVMPNAPVIEPVPEPTPESPPEPGPPNPIWLAVALGEHDGILYLAHNALDGSYRLAVIAEADGADPRITTRQAAPRPSITAWSAPTAP